MEDFIAYELAVKLKEKGFNWICSHYYRTKCKDLFMVFPSEDWSNTEERINTPTISQVLKWLREEKKIYVGITYMPKIPNETGVLNDFYYPTFQKIGLFEPMFFIGNGKNYDTYEQAAIAGIEFALNKLI